VSHIQRPVQLHHDRQLCPDQPAKHSDANGVQRKHQLTTWGTANLFYDLNGNMTSNGTDGYTWDARNRLVSTLSGASFQYDAFGRRTSKTIGGATTTFLYDGANAVQEGGMSVTGTKREKLVHANCSERASRVLR